MVNIDCLMYWKKKFPIINKKIFGYNKKKLNTNMDDIKSNLAGELGVRNFISIYI